MRLLLITQDAGANLLRAEGLGREYARAGHEVWVAAPPERFQVRPSAIKNAGLDELRAAGLGEGELVPQAFNPWTIFGMARAVRDLNIDLVHSFGHRPSASFPSRVLQRRSGTIHVADWSDWWGRGGIAAERSWAGRVSVGVLDDALERWSRRRADGLTVATEHLAIVARSWGIEPSRVKLFLGGANVDQIRPLAKQAAREKCGVSSAGPILVHAGRSAFDLAFLMDCFAEVARHQPEARMMLIGTDQRLARKHARRTGQVDRLLWFDRVAHGQLGELLACGDLMLLPFADAGFNLGRFPQRLGDFLAAERPLVTNAVGEVGSLVEQYGVGLAAKPNPEATAEAVLEILGDRERADRLARRGREFAERKLAWPVVAAEVLEFYEGLRNSRVNRGQCPDASAHVEYLL